MLSNNFCELFIHEIELSDMCVFGKPPIHKSAPDALMQ